MNTEISIQQITSKFPQKREHLDIVLISADSSAKVQMHPKSCINIGLPVTLCRDQKTLLLAGIEKVRPGTPGTSSSLLPFFIETESISVKATGAPLGQRRVLRYD